MKRTHRSWHVRIWVVLAPWLAIGIFLGFNIRPGRVFTPRTHDSLTTVEPLAVSSERPEGVP